MAHTWTWDKLAKNAYRLNPKSRGQNYPYVPKYEFQKFTSGQNRGQKTIVPFIGTKSVLISMRAWGVTQSALHNVTLLFSDVDILKEDPQSSNYFQIEYEGQMYWIQKLDRFKHPLTWRCSCFDTFFTWAWQAYYIGHCLYGPPPKPFQRKGLRPPRNAQNLVGICKHVYHAWAILRNSGMTTN